jgi:hypothetical protein
MLSTISKGRWKKPLFPISGLLVDESRIKRRNFNGRRKKCGPGDSGNAGESQG